MGKQTNHYDITVKLQSTSLYFNIRAHNLDQARRVAKRRARNMGYSMLGVGTSSVRGLSFMTPSA